MENAGAQEIQVVGAGFAGLAVAYFLQRRGARVRLVENAARSGGLLRTIQTPYGISESAANALLSNAVVERTATDLGVELVPALPSAKRRYVYRGGKFRRFPLNGVAATRFLGETVPRFFLARKSFFPKPGESILAWGQRCLGHEATTYLLTPGLSGVYAGDPARLSASLILGPLLRGERRVPRGNLRGSVAPRGGMGELTAALARALPPPTTEARDDLPTVVALPPPAASEFLRERAPSLSAELARIEMVSLLSATVFLPAEGPGIEGFGSVFPRPEGFRVLGVLANDRIFPDRAAKGFRSETWIFGGAGDPGVTDLSDEAVRALIEEERTRLLGSARLAHLVVHRWPRAIPNYSLGLEEVLARLPRREKNFTLFGTYLGDLGLGRVLLRAEALAQELHP